MNQEILQMYFGFFVLGPILAWIFFKIDKILKLKAETYISKAKKEQNFFLVFLIKILLVARKLLAIFAFIGVILWLLEDDDD